MDCTVGFGTDLQRGKTMKDTRPEVAAQFRNLMKAKSNEQRLLMGCSMFDTAKQIVQSSIYSQHPGITPEEMKIEIFLRFYGQDFSQADKDKILAAQP
jgi:hypothetical protein